MCLPIWLGEQSECVHTIWYSCVLLKYRNQCCTHTRHWKTSKAKVGAWQGRFSYSFFQALPPRIWYMFSYWLFTASAAVHIYERSAAAATDVECYLQFLWSVRASVWRNDIPLCVRRDFRLISRYSFLGGVPRIPRRNKVSLRMSCCCENIFQTHVRPYIFWMPFYTNASTRGTCKPTKPLKNCATTFTTCWPAAFVLFLGGMGAGQSGKRENMHVYR